MAQGPNQPKATCFWKLSFIVTHICMGAEAELPNDGASLGFFGPSWSKGIQQIFLEDFCPQNRQ